MDFNVALVEKVSSTVGCKYMSVENIGEFTRIMKEDFF